MKSLQAKKSVRQALRGVRLVAFDFDGVFTDNRVFVFEDGREAVRCHRADGIGLSRLRSLGIETVVISTETNPVVRRRCRKLRVPCVTGCRDKAEALRRLAERKRIPLSETVFVGNDVNDEECLRAAGLPIVTRDAHPDVIRLGRYRTRARGGAGAVREVCDLICATAAR